MTQMWLLWWPRNTKSRVDTGVATNITTSTTTTTTTATTTTTSLPKSGSTKCCSACVKKFLKKLKRQGRILRAATASRQSSFQCRYDPLSYSLNFDTSGSLKDDEDYYQFYAFSSRFVANPRRDLLVQNSCTTIVNAVQS